MSHRLGSVFEGLREGALSFVDQEAPAGDLYGVVMETGLAEGVATLVALGDGGVSLYFSNGSGFLGAGEHEGLARTAHRFATTAARFVESMPVDPERSWAREGETKFFVLIGGAVRSAGANSRDLADGRHALSPLFRAGHTLLAELRQLHPEG